MMMSTSYQVVGIPQYGGRCVKCGREARTFEAILLRDDEGKRYAVAHADCIGVRTKNKINRGRVIVGGPTSVTIN